MVRPVHLVVLHHGMWGEANDMAYTMHTLRGAARHGVVVLNTDVNAARLTYDGIDVLGDRLVSLVLRFCQRLTAGNLRRVTQISFVAYSLGGLVARYAIGKLASLGFFKHVEPVNYVSFASPHLGSWQAPTSLYRCAFNAVLPYTLSRTGSQLVLSDRFHRGRPLLEVLADPGYAFHAGLAMFRKRIALANTRHDATVPYCTAAMCLDDDPYTGHPGYPISMRYPCIVRPALVAELLPPPYHGPKDAFAVQEASTHLKGPVGSSVGNPLRDTTDGLESPRSHSGPSSGGASLAGEHTRQSPDSLLSPRFPGGAAMPPRSPGRDARRSTWPAASTPSMCACGFGSPPPGRRVASDTGEINAAPALTPARTQPHLSSAWQAGGHSLSGGEVSQSTGAVPLSIRPVAHPPPPSPRRGSAGSRSSGGSSGGRRTRVHAVQGSVHSADLVRGQGDERVRASATGQTGATSPQAACAPTTWSPMHWWRVVRAAAVSGQPAFRVPSLSTAVTRVLTLITSGSHASQLPERTTAAAGGFVGSRPESLTRAPGLHGHPAYTGQSYARPGMYHRPAPALLWSVASVMWAPPPAIPPASPPRGVTGSPQHSPQGAAGAGRASRRGSAAGGGGRSGGVSEAAGLFRRLQRVGSDAGGHSPVTVWEHTLRQPVLSAASHPHSHHGAQRRVRSWGGGAPHPPGDVQLQPAWVTGPLAAAARLRPPPREPAGRMRGEVFLALLPVLLLLWGCMLLWLVVLSAHHYLVRLGVRRDRSWDMRWSPQGGRTVSCAAVPDAAPDREQPAPHDHVNSGPSVLRAASWSVAPGTACTGVDGPALGCSHASAAATSAGIHPGGCNDAQRTSTEAALPEVDGVGVGVQGGSGAGTRRLTRSTDGRGGGAVHDAVWGTALFTAHALLPASALRVLQWAARWEVWAGWLRSVVLTRVAPTAAAWWSVLEEQWWEEWPVAATLAALQASPEQVLGERGARAVRPLLAACSSLAARVRAFTGAASVGPPSGDAGAAAGAELSELRPRGEACEWPQPAQQRAMCDALCALTWERVDVNTGHFHAHAAIVVRSAPRFAVSHGHIVSYAIRRMDDIT